MSMALSIAWYDTSSVPLEHDIQHKYFHKYVKQSSHIMG